MPQIEVWKWGYFPFNLGGSVLRPIKTTVSVDEPVDLGAGYQGYVVNSPNGKTKREQAQAVDFEGFFSPPD